MQSRSASAGRFVRGGSPLAICFVVLVSLAACVEKKEAPAPGEATARTAAPSTADEILFGEVGSLTGQEATFGNHSRNGIAMAVREINEAGGIDGKKIRVITYDNQGKPTEAAAAATRLIVQDKVHILLGEVASARSLAMAPIAQANRVPMITHASTNPRVTENKPYVFRICFIDPFQGKVMARFARENLALDKVAILRDVRNDYSVGLADFFTQSFKSSGGTITGDVSYSSGDIDFKAQLTALRGARPQALFVPGYYTDVALIARQARELGIDAPLLGGDGWDSPALLEIGGDALQGSFFSNHYSQEDPSPVIRRFVSNYEKLYGEAPGGMAALGYDAARVAAEAIRKAGSLDGDAIRDALAKIENFPGVTGSITIDENRNAVKPAVVLEVKGSKTRYKTTIDP